MTKKNLLILERSAGNLELNKETSGEYVLEGIFGEIDVKNKNNRIYTESEYVPQIKALQDKIKSSKLLGELDHPANFDISLKNVSHIIEELTYDEKSKQVRGRIRLLDTEAGKQAKALVDAGVPLQISSRAAGAVESNGQVKIKQLFTYDLVADPGFANAELSRVNESFGFALDSDIQIYEINSTEELIKEDNIENNKTETMLNEENSKFVSTEDFNKYSEYLSEEIKSLKATISKLNETNENTKNEETSKLKEYINYIAETLDNSITYTEATADGVNSIKEYTNYLAESFNESVDTVSGLNERMDQVTAYAEYVAESVNANVIVEDRAEEIEAELMDDGEPKETEAAAELLDDVVESLDIEIVTEEEMLAEEKEIEEGNAFGDAVRKAKDAGEKEFEFEGKTYKVEEAELEESKGCGCGNAECSCESNEVTEEVEAEEEVTEEVEAEEEVTEEVEAEEVTEEVEAEEEVTESDEEVTESDEEESEEEEEESEEEEPEAEEISEDLELDLEIVTESELVVSNYQDEVHSKLQTIIDASNRKPSTNPGFFSFVSESVQNDFKALNEDDKATVLKAVEKQGFLSEGQIVSLWNTSLAQVQESDLPVIALMPVEYKETWDKLSEGKRTSLIAQSKFHNTNSQYEVKTFWQTRDMRETSIDIDKVNSMNESNIHMSAKPTSSLPYDLTDMKTAITKQFKK